jgi:hypothetical protein
MKKMNWGSWIIVSLVIFVLATFVMVYISMSQRVDLVTDDYYEKELQYQQHIDIVNNTNALDGKVNFDVGREYIKIIFPKVDAHRKYSGIIFFFRPSDKTQDFSQTVDVDSLYTQTIPTGKLMKGMWRVKISWHVGAEQYYTEQTVIIQ